MKRRAETTVQAAQQGLNSITATCCAACATLSAFFSVQKLVAYQVAVMEFGPNRAYAAALRRGRGPERLLISYNVN